MLQSLLNILTETTNSIMPGESTSQETEQTPTTNANNNNNDIPTTAATASSEVLTTATTTAAASTAVTTPQPFVRPPPPPAADPEFMEVYDCAKLNNNWHKVSTALTTHPEWLSRIPEGRRWTMLHQIVFSGDVVHLNEALSSQINNADFRLLCKALDDKTVREVASDRAHIHPQMLRRIERLVASDQLLNNAKDNKWDLVKQCINLQPDIANEKPPYRHFYLAHQLAFNGDLNMFKELSEKCHFKLDVLADNKTISQIAREQNHTEFAEHIDTLINQANESSATANGNETTNENDDDFGSHDSDGPYHFSPGFYEDPGISFLPANLDLNNLFPNSHHHTTFSNFGNHNSNYNHFFVTHSLYQGPHHGTMSVANLEHNAIDEFETNAHEGSTSVEPKPVLPSMTDEEQTAYEQKVKENVQNMSHQNLLNSITCRLTKKILHDPVVAADGFTYERQAIMEWFQHSKRSPVTDEELENFELKPNYAIKSILQLLQENNSIQPSNNENAASSK